MNISYCAVTGLAVYGRRHLTGVVLHPEFYTVGFSVACSQLQRAFDLGISDATNINLETVRLSIAVMLMHSGLISEHCCSEPYMPKTLVHESAEHTDALEEIAAAVQLATWAAHRVKATVAALTEHTCRSLLEGVSRDAMAQISDVIHSLPESLAGQVYSLAESLSNLSLELIHWGLDSSSMDTTLKLVLYCYVAANYTDEPFETVELIQGRIARILANYDWGLLDECLRTASFSYPSVRLLKPVRSKLNSMRRSITNHMRQIAIPAAVTTDILHQPTTLKQRLNELRLRRSHHVN